VSEYAIAVVKTVLVSELQDVMRLKLCRHCVGPAECRDWRRSSDLEGD
jgi:hypothetical protein